MSLINYIQIPNHLWKNIYQTGSSVICDPPVTNTDIDFVIYYNNHELPAWLYEKGFTCSSKDREEYELAESSSMLCLRKDNINLILVDDYIFYQRWVRATILAKQFNLIKKYDRISLFNAILYPDDFIIKEKDSEMIDFSLFDDDEIPF